MITFSQKTLVFFLDQIFSSLLLPDFHELKRYVNNISSHDASTTDLVVVSDLLMIKTKLRYCGNIE